MLNAKEIKKSEENYKVYLKIFQLDGTDSLY